MQPISYQRVEPYCFGPQTQDAETTQEERIIDFLNENKHREALLLIAENPDVLLDRDLLEGWEHLCFLSLFSFSKDMKMLAVEVKLRILAIYHKEFSIQQKEVASIIHCLLNSLSEQEIEHNPSLKKALISWITCYDLSPPLPKIGSLIGLLFKKSPRDIQALLKDKYGSQTVESHLELQKNLDEIKTQRRFLSQLIECARIARAKWAEISTEPFPDKQDADIRSRQQRIVSTLNQYSRESTCSEESPVVFTNRGHVQIVQNLIEIALCDPALYRALPWVFSTKNPREYKPDAVGHSLGLLLLDKCPALFTPPWEGNRWEKITNTEMHVELLLSTMARVQQSPQFNTMLSEEDRVHLLTVLDGLSASLVSLLYPQVSMMLQEKHYFPLLCSVNTKFLDEGVDHALLVEVQDRHLLLYNTGYGIEEHPQSADKKLYQTYLQTRFSPEDRNHILFEWNRYNSGYSIEEIYSKFRQVGIVDSPSSNPIDYEQMQCRGSCTAQSLMAFIRHRLLSSIPGSSEHKLGVYKAIKTEWFSALIQVYGECFNIPPMDELRPHIQRKAKELEYEKKLLEQCMCQKSFQDMMDTLNQPISAEIDVGSPYARYLFVHKALRALIYKSAVSFSALEGPGKSYLEPLALVLEEEKKEALDRQVAWYTSAGPEEKQEAKERCFGSHSIFWWAPIIQTLYKRSNETFLVNKHLSI